MAYRTPLFALSALLLLALGSLGVSDCEGDSAASARDVLGHEDRIAALEASCELPLDCGGEEGLACEEGEFCELPRGSCDSMAAGLCNPIPEACTDEFAPVCGCDGTTYPNDCERRAAGVPFDHRGECGSLPVECVDNGDCTDDELCRKRMGNCEGRGVCMPRPEVCPLFIDEVCGCDGETYDNECAALANGVSLDADVACEEIRDKVAVCHIPPGNPGNFHTIHVGEPAVRAHLGHGDYVGRCEEGRN